MSHNLRSGTVTFCFLLAGAGTLSGNAAVPWGEKRNRRKEHQVTRITFERSGGFVAAPGLNIKGTADLQRDETAEVKADTAGYHRGLSPQEAQKLRSMINFADFVKLGSDLRKQTAKAESTADQYQYDITVETSEGQHHTVTIGDQPASELDRLAPGLGRLAEWIRNESRAIWNRKISRASQD